MGRLRRGWALGALLGALLGGCDDGAPAAPVDGAVDRGTAPGDQAVDPGADLGADLGADAAVDPGHTLGDAAALSLHAATDGTLTLRWAGAPRLVLPPDAWRVGVADAVADTFHYDPWQALQPEPRYQPRGLAWRTPRGVAVDAEGEGLRLTLDLGDDLAATVALTLDAAGIAGHLVPTGEAAVVYLGLRPTVDAEEGFYGLGEVFDHVNHRGLLRAMQLEIDLSLESANNEANVPVPFLIGTSGWGLFVDSNLPGAFAVATQAEDQVEALFGTGEFSGDGLRFHLYAAAHPLDLVKPYYQTAGFPTLPAPWALGPWVWRDENEDQAQVLGDLDAMRDLDLATTGIWIDRPYASGVSSFDFDPGMFPDPQAMIDRAHALGFRFALWHTSYVGEDQPATAELHAEAEANGYYPPQVGPIVNNWGRPVDLTNPEAYAWWQALVGRYAAMGVEGYKLDYVQDVVLGVGRVRNAWRFHDGTTERTRHQTYQGLYHQVFAETLPAEGGFLLARTGLAGDQTHGVIIWPGDLDATLARRGTEQTDARRGETYTATGGLPASLVAGLSLGPSGFPFYGSDTGGYRHCPPDKETFVRWFEQTALSSVMQVGTSCNDVAWEPTEANGFDGEVLDWYRTYTRLHLRLWPLAWTLAHGLAETGRPLMRPFGLQHPELGQHPDAVYFFGDDLLVAPVVDRGARIKAVPFPPGRWFDWWTGEVREGTPTGALIQVDAPLGTLPLFLREGGVVPLLRPTIDTLAPTTEPARVDSFATEAGALHLRLAAGDGALTLYDGTAVTQAQGAEGWTLTVTPGDVFAQGVVVEAWGLGAPAQVTVDGQPSDGWQVVEGRFELPLPPGPHTVEVR